MVGALHAIQPLGCAHHTVSFRYPGSDLVFNLPTNDLTPPGHVRPGDALLSLDPARALRWVHRDKSQHWYDNHASDMASALVLFHTPAPGTISPLRTSHKSRQAIIRQPTLHGSHPFPKTPCILTRKFDTARRVRSHDAADANVCSLRIGGIWPNAPSARPSCRKRDKIELMQQ
ncbi:hypothetical protein BD779DRAFT_1471585 [Infundibulicybe gibba]|nr:hypothetical protein BD779DRAFT_1471585 [Infundibulicybe gibba]